MDHPPAPTLGRYMLLEEIASGGMAKVHLAQMQGPHGFSKLVAIKCLHAEYAKSEEFVAMLLDEARLLSRVRHPNVVPILEVLEGDPLALVMEYVDGTTVARLQKSHAAIPLAIVAAIACDMLEGLHAAHEATNSANEPLSIVHRDVSPQNVMVDRDGIAKVLDFGVAKAEGRMTASTHGSLKGKAGYMAPEQVRGGDVDRRCDIFAAGIVIWELLTAERFASADNPVASMLRILEEAPEPPSRRRPDVPAELDAVVLRALQRRPENRFPTAREMALAIEAAVRPASRREVASWVAAAGSDDLKERAELVERAKTKATELAHGTITAKRSALSIRAVVPIAAGFVGVLALATVLHARGTERQAPVPAAFPVPAPIPTPSAAEVESTAVPTPSIGPSSSARAPGSARAPSKGGGGKKRSTATPPRCDPPYTVRQDGIHVPKEECL